MFGAQCALCPPQSRRPCTAAAITRLQTFRLFLPECARRGTLKRRLAPPACKQPARRAAEHGKLRLAGRRGRARPYVRCQPVPRAAPPCPRRLRGKRTPGPLPGHFRACRGRPVLACSPGAQASPPRALLLPARPDPRHDLFRELRGRQPPAHVRRARPRRDRAAHGAFHGPSGRAAPLVAVPARKPAEHH